MIIGWRGPCQELLELLSQKRPNGQTCEQRADVISRPLRLGSDGRST